MVSSWYLESSPDERGRIRRTAIRPLPFRVGRRIDSDLFLNSSHGSHRHAELFERDGEIWVADLDSTNGTTVNGERLKSPRRLESGDVVLFADCELRLVELPSTASLQTTQVFSLIERERLEALVRAPGEFRRMLRDRGFRTDFQPVVRIDDGAVRGYEMLGRGELGGAEASPEELFYIAEKLGDAIALSEAFRSRGLELAARLPGAASDPRPLLFMNTHPLELVDTGALLSSLEVLRGDHPNLALVLEIHEATVAEVSSLKALRAGLEQLDIDVAFDDFGTGQARLLELAEVAPHYLKFDAAWVDGLHFASDRRNEMVASLLRMVDELGITSVAECVESREEAEACLRLGFQLAQGNYFGSPVPTEELGTAGED
ncbi:MAG: EAL domain-containing protein [bacterium]|nr:EAL domain-containing protein [bacterium]